MKSSGLVFSALMSASNSRSRVLTSFSGSRISVGPVELPEEFHWVGVEELPDGSGAVLLVAEKSAPPAAARRQTALTTAHGTHFRCDVWRGSEPVSCITSCWVAAAKI